jgi:hypothetical protein
VVLCGLIWLSVVALVFVAVVIYAVVLLAAVAVGALLLRLTVSCGSGLAFAGFGVEVDFAACGADCAVGWTLLA